MVKTKKDENKKEVSTSTENKAVKKTSGKNASTSKNGASKKTANKTNTTKKEAPNKTANKTSATKKSSLRTNSKKQTTKSSSDTKKKSSSTMSADKVLGVKNKKKETATDKVNKIKKREAQKKVEDEKLKNKKSFSSKLKNNKLKTKKKKASFDPNSPAAKQMIRRKKIIKKRIVIVFATCVAILFVILGLFKICGYLEPNAGLAAKIGEKIITEAEVTNYIKEFTYYKQYSKNQSKWAQYINMYGNTAESFRTQCIEEKFKHEELVRLAAEKEGITISDSDVDAHVQSFKNKYAKDADYKKALETAGYTEDTYRQSVYNTMLEKALIEHVIKVDPPSDDDVKTYLSSYSSLYKDARRSSHILFSAKDSQKASQVLEQLKAGTLTWESAVLQYSTDLATKDKDGDVGWDKIESFSTAYNDGLTGLSVGEYCKDIVTDKDGIHIIKCTDKWDTPEKIESLDGIPQDIINDARKKKNESNQSKELKKWLDNFATENGIETIIYPIPKSVPYYVEPTPLSTNIGGTTGSSVPLTSTEM